MAFLDSIGLYLQAAAVGTVGTDLFKGQMPDVPEVAACIYEYAGSPPEQAHNARQSVRPGLQVVVRNSDYEAARAKIETIFNLLDRVTNTDVQGLDVIKIEAVQSPFPLGIDDNGRYRLAVNFQVEHRN